VQQIPQDAASTDLEQRLRRRANPVLPRSGAIGSVSFQVRAWFTKQFICRSWKSAGPIHARAHQQTHYGTSLVPVLGVAVMRCNLDASCLRNVVAQIFTSWNPLVSWLRRLTFLSVVPDRSRVIPLV
jgi:hypothetical protein